MNFNDIELRLRYPHLFRDQELPNRVPSNQIVSDSPAQTRKIRRTDWRHSFSSLIWRTAR